ncbi:MAG: hypothetical protein ACLP50_25360 [Solirubrobacteraceae bacterium]
MRLALVTTVLAGAAIVAAPAALGSTPGQAPSRAQITSAVRQAERSPSLWATINICNSRRYRDILGVRGQLPALGFPSELSMDIQVNYWSTGENRFVAIDSPKAISKVSLGSASTEAQQGGGVFSFPPHSGLLNATIEFTWTLDGKVIGQTQRRTTAGHPGADFGSPPHFSAASCEIP